MVHHPAAITVTLPAAVGFPVFRCSNEKNLWVCAYVHFSGKEAQNFHEIL